MDEKTIEKLKSNFKNFLFVVFSYINLPSPTDIQYAIADELQHRISDLILNGFRGVAKSTITGIYVAWLFFCDPINTQIIYVGANQEEAKKFMKFVRGLFEVVPFLNFLIPDVNAGQRDNALSFDVAPAGIRVQPSCKAVGIFGNLTGNRATHIIADDIETSENCDTQLKREHIESAVTEFRQIVAPSKGSLLFLGTPHTELSIYNKLYNNKGIPIKIFPIRFPTQQQQEKYGDKLAGYIVDKINQDPTLIGTSTDPLRFGEEDIIKLEAEGRSKFAMQQMLDTTLSDLERYPLKCSDLIVMDLNKDIAPEKVAYGSATNQIIKDLPCNGIGTDKYYSPIPLPDIKWLPYNYIIMAIDPSGRGKDELAYTIVGVMNGYLYLLKQGGMQGGYSEDNLNRLAYLAKEYKVNKVKIESNFGDGMFTTLLSPILRKIYPCAIEEIRHNTQKERRIIDTLEPVMNQHRLVVDKQVVKDDMESVKIYPLDVQQQYSLFYQMTRITKDRGSLNHDDRLDCLAMAVADCLEMLQVDVEAEIQQRIQEELDAEIARFDEMMGIYKEDDLGWFDIN